MKSTEIGDSAVTNGIDDANNFGFILDAHAYKLFADSLYSDKQLAPLREYTTNAIDSLIESGNEDKGYIVHLPNRLEPHWSIRDFGTGIDDCDMPSLFCFNKSDKRNTNKLNGTFGLGSKAFLSISDTATFTSYYNGMKYVYLVFKDKGMPTYTRVEASETTEPNGLEVMIPIDSNHFYDIIEKYKKFCRYVSIKPTVIGHDKSSWDATFERFKAEEIDLGNGCSFHDKANYYMEQRPVIVFGNVSYNLQQRIEGFNYKRVAVMQVPIGSVDIVPSREELAMTEKTLKYLETLAPMFKERVDKYIKDYYKEHGFIDTIKMVVSNIGSVEDYPINGKSVSLKVNVSSYARSDSYYNKVTFRDMVNSNCTVTYETNVLLNFEKKVVRYKPRIRKYALDNDGTVVVISDPEEAKKYCEHFEIDISTLKHLKDVEPPEIKKATFDSKGYRFTGLRKLNEYSYQVECGDIDLSSIDTIYYVYRKNKKLFREYKSGDYIDDVTEKMKHVNRSVLWKNTDIYTLTYRQVKQCKNAGIEIINVIDHIESTVDVDVLLKSAKYVAYNKVSTYFSRLLNNAILLDILPKSYHFITDVVKSEEYNAYINEGGKLYIDMNLGDDIIMKEHKSLREILSGDFGKFLVMYNRSYEEFSKEFIDMVLTGLAKQIKSKKKKTTNKRLTSTTK